MVESDENVTTLKKIQKFRRWKYVHTPHDLNLPGLALRHNTKKSTLCGWCRFMFLCFTVSKHRRVWTNSIKLQIYNNRWADGDNPIALHPPLDHYHPSLRLTFSPGKSSILFFSSCLSSSFTSHIREAISGGHYLLIIQQQTPSWRQLIVGTSLMMSAWHSWSYLVTAIVKPI